MIDYIIKENTLLVFIKGEIDHHTAVDLRIETDGLIKKYNPKKTILDFRHVSFCDSSGIALVLGRYKLMNLLGGEFEISGLPTHVKRVFDLVGLEKHISITKEVNL